MKNQTNFTNQEDARRIAEQEEIDRKKFLSDRLNRLGVELQEAHSQSTEKGKVYVTTETINDWYKMVSESIESLGL